MDAIDALTALLAGWPVAFALLYPFYACLRVAWDVWVALTTFD